jgi:apolipoprotein N-acyltransferase
MTKWLEFGCLLGAAVVLGVFSPFEKAPWFCSIVLVPLVHMLRHGDRTGILKGLTAGWIFGTVSWASGTFWLVNAMESLMDPAFWQSWLSLAAIWFYQGIPFALFGAVCGWMNRMSATASPLFCASLLTLLIYLRPALFPVSWTVTVVFWTEFIQIADLGGELLICFCLIWINCLASDMFFGIRQREIKAFGVSLLYLSILLVSVLVYGTWRISLLNRDLQAVQGQSLSVASVQPCVPVRWDVKGLDNFKTDEAFCLQALIKHRDVVMGADLLVFPELPRFDCRSEEFEKSGLKSELEHLKIPVLFHGKKEIPSMEAPVIHRVDERKIVEQKMDARYSAVFFMSHGEECTLAYRKRIPVPFSETSLSTYFFPEQVEKPAGKLWLSRGESPGLLQIKTFLVQPLICFESGFAELAREGIELGADLLVEFSNDGWFFSRRAEMKHLGMSVFRAAEFRRPLIRCSNSGSGAHVSAAGKIVDGTLTPHGKACVTKSLLLCPDVLTVFARWGNAWLWVAVLIVCWKVLAVMGGGRRV